MSSAPPSEPPSAAGNFESFLLHRVIFVSAGPRTSKRPPRLSSRRLPRRRDSSLSARPGRELPLDEARTSLRCSDNATSKAFTPLWLPKWNNFFNSRIYVGGSPHPPSSFLRRSPYRRSTFLAAVRTPAENISQPPFHQPLLLPQELVDFSFKSTCLKLRLPHFIYCARYLAM